MSDVDLDRLFAVPLFAEVDRAHLGQIAAAAMPFEVEPGHVLAERGQPGAGMFVILEGTVAVDVPGFESITLGEGEFFGELSLLTDTPRSARVRATTPVRAIAIERRAFEALLHEEPRIALGMLPVLARRLASLERGPG